MFKLMIIAFTMPLRDYIDPDCDNFSNYDLKRIMKAKGSFVSSSSVNVDDEESEPDNRYSTHYIILQGSI